MVKNEEYSSNGDFTLMFRERQYRKIQKILYMT